MTTVYLICFVLGLSLSLLSVFGLGRLHIGHAHVGHVHTGHGLGKATGTHPGFFNGFTLAAFLCWFGGAGYLLSRYSAAIGLVIAVLAIVAGLIGTSIIYGLLFKLLLPRERVLTLEDTRMEGTLACVSDEVRALNGIGEVIFSQAGARRAAPARSEDGTAIPRGREVVVLRYERGIATVRPLNELSHESSNTNL